MISHRILNDMLNNFITMYQNNCMQCRRPPDIRMTIAAGGICGGEGSANTNNWVSCYCYVLSTTRILAYDITIPTQQYAYVMQFLFYGMLRQKYIITGHQIDTLSVCCPGYCCNTNKYEIIILQTTPIRVIEMTKADRTGGCGGH